MKSKIERYNQIVTVVFSEEDIPERERYKRILDIIFKQGAKPKIKYHEPVLPLDDYQVGQTIAFQWGKKWEIIGKTKNGNLKLRERV